MSGLVSYGMGSSDESDSSDNEESNAPATSKPQPQPQRPDEQGPSLPPKLVHEEPVKQVKSSLFASLPKPKTSSGPSLDTVSGVSPSGHAGSADDRTDSASSQGSASGPKKTSLFSSLPPPKKNTSQAPQKKSDTGDQPSTMIVSAGTSSGSSKGFLSLPPPKKKQPVKITLPSLPDPDSDEDEPQEKKPKTTKGAGLFAMLPKPRTASRKEANRILIPHTLTKKPAPMPIKTPPQPKPQQALPKTTTSHSHKPSGSNPLVSGYNSDDDDNDDDDSGKVNFFSVSEEKKKETIRTEASGNSYPPPDLLGVSSSKGSTHQRGLHSESNSRTALDAAPVEGPASETMEPDPTVQDQPLVFNSTKSYSSGYHLPNYQQRIYNPAYDASSSSHGVASGAVGSDGAQGQFVAGSHEASGGMQYYNQPYVEGSDGSQSGLETQATSSQQQFIHDEGFAKMVGKRNRGKEEFQIIDINADDQIGPTSGLQAMVKSMTEEKEYRGKLKKEQLPTSQQKRKHQITYLARQAKERELELKNQWADNRMTRKQTQAKYGF